MNLKRGGTLSTPTLSTPSYDKAETGTRILKEIGKVQLGSSVLIWLLLCICSFMGPLDMVAGQAVFFAGLGLLIVLLPAREGGVPRNWIWMVLAYLACSALCFLPVALLGGHDWRVKLKSLGVEMGGVGAVQSRAALESWVIYGLSIAGGLWLAARRESMAAVKWSATLFVSGVAIYALLAKWAEGRLDGLGGEGHFGFFPNRNHSATLLAMGFIIGIGCLVQSIRERRFVWAGIVFAAVGVILIALLQWSISRAGVVLAVAGLAGFVLLAGKGRGWVNLLRPITLVMLAGVGFFVIGQTELKERLLGMFGSDVARAGSEVVDFRIPTWHDTLSMISDAPLTGVGAGQFRFVFPQYKDRTATNQVADTYHPESDWLWCAAESGVPATLALAALVGVAGWHSFRRLNRGRLRALRGGGLMAALLLPIHGLFDVPGHRTVLLWTAVWLFSLSLPPRDGEWRESMTENRFAGWTWKFVGLALLLAGLGLGGSAWFQKPLLAVTAADQALRETEELVAMDHKSWVEAHARGEKYDPQGVADPLRRASGLLNQAIGLSPMDKRLYRSDGALGLQYYDRHVRIDRLFEIEAALDPQSIEVPFRQGGLWAPYDAERAKLRWTEAIERAKRIDERLHLQGENTRETLRRISEMGRNYPALESWLTILKGNE